MPLSRPTEPPALRSARRTASAAIRRVATAGVPSCGQGVKYASSSAIEPTSAERTFTESVPCAVSANRGR